MSRASLDRHPHRRVSAHRNKRLAALRALSARRLPRRSSALRRELGSDGL